MPTCHSEFLPSTLHPLLTRRPCGNVVQYYPQVDSTNTVVRDAAHTGHPEGLVVIAEHQQAGRGQRGRSWVDSPGQSLLASLLLRPTWLAPRDTLHLINAFVAVLAESIATCIHHPVRIKWPNDIVVSDAHGTFKVAGVLCEGHANAHHMHHIVVGFGVNVHFQPSSIVDGVDVAQTSRSLQHWYPAITRQQVLVETLNRFDALYQTLQHDVHAYQEHWHAHLAHMLDQPIRVRQNHTSIHGIVRAIAPDGSLIVETNTGRVHVTSGIMEDISGIRPHHPSG